MVTVEKPVKEIPKPDTAAVKPPVAEGYRLQFLALREPLEDIERYFAPLTKITKHQHFRYSR